MLQASDFGTGLSLNHRNTLLSPLTGLAIEMIVRGAHRCAEAHQEPGGGPVTHMTAVYDQLRQSVACLC